MVKRFVIDTNIFLHNNPQSVIDGFDDNIIIICGTVLQELDRHKTDLGETGFNARETCRLLDEINKQGDLIRGVPTKSGGMITLEPDGISQDLLPHGYSIERPDNRIISTCIYLKKIIRNEQKVVLVTNDTSMRLNATACGVEVQEYWNSIVEESGYKGYTDMDVDSEVINSIYKSKTVEINSVEGLLENEFVTLHAGNQSALSIFRNGRFHLIPSDQKLYGWVKPKNALQSYAMWALTAPAEEIPLVILIGPPGVAKTFLSIAAGLDQTYVAQDRSGSPYYKMLISRPSSNAFQNEGFLPGSLSDKLHYLYNNFYDNIENLLLGDDRHREDHTQIQTQMEDLISDNVIEITSLSFIRGRSLSNVYMIADEVQNASKTLVRDIVTRAGIGTKVVLAGDPDQIDLPSLDRHTCGLTFAAESMKGDPTTCIINFTGCDEKAIVRSTLSRRAAHNMRLH